jgi:hypothetical protein
MFDKVIAEIDAHIARLHSARAALSGITATPAAPAAKRRGRPPGKVSLAAAAAKPAKKSKRRGMSPEGRARIAAAQKARWAKLKSGK